MIVRFIWSNYYEVNYHQHKGGGFLAELLMKWNKQLYFSNDVCTGCFQFAVMKQLNVTFWHQVPEDFMDIIHYSNTCNFICPHYRIVKKAISNNKEVNHENFHYCKRGIKKIVSWGWGILHDNVLRSTCPKFFLHIHSHISDDLAQKTRPKKRPKQGINKDICRKCVKQRNNKLWTINDDKLWDNYGLVRCGCEKFALTHRATPEECPYKLEQTVCKIL